MLFIHYVKNLWSFKNKILHLLNTSFEIVKNIRFFRDTKNIFYLINTTIMKKNLLVFSIAFLLQLTLIPSVFYAQSWSWAKSAGGNQKVESYAIAIDNAGNSYITGYFEDSLKFGTTTLFSAGIHAFVSDIFIAKYDINGAFVWAKQAGGNNYDYGTGIATDAAGNVFVTGLFTGTATFGSLQVTSTTVDYDVFIAKYAPDGTALWVNGGGGSAWDVGSGITIDMAGNCYVTGAYRNTAVFGTTSLVSAGNYDAYIAKYDNAGTFVWAKSAGGTLDDRGFGISTDASRNCFVTGYFNGTAMVGITSLVSAGGSDVWLAKYAADGTEVWAKRAGGTSADEGKSITTDDIGNSHITGYFSGTAVFDTATLVSAGSNDIFAGKYDYKGDIIWMKKLGGAQDDAGYGISTDSIGNCYVSGSFFGTAVFDTITVISSNQDDAFIAGLDYYGKTKWVAQGGGVNPDIGRGVAVSDLGSCYTSGYFSGAGTFGTHSITGYSDNDLFIAKLDSAFIVNPPNTGIKDEGTGFNTLIVYPNPSNMEVTLQFESSTANNKINIELYDILGKAVTHKAVISEMKNLYAKKQLTINRGTLPDGLYFAKVIAGNKIYSSRLMLIAPNGIK